MRTIVNMVSRLNSKYDFWVITRDHDGKLDLEQYKTVEINQWNDVENAKVFYLSKNSVTMSKLRELILEVEPDLYYANSFFATLSIYLVKLRKLGSIPYKNIIIAPCGELSDGSLKLKPLKKWGFINWSKLFNLYKNIIWKASSDLEKAEIKKIKGHGGKVFISPDLAPRTLNEDYLQNKKPLKVKGAARMIFLSRFVRKKNFKWLVNQLFSIKGDLSIDVYGPLEDKEYWNECATIIKKLPSNIKIVAKGSIPYPETAEKLLEYQFFILPTLTENFGHVFLEALAAGCPLIISDRTPFLNLKEEGIGWDLPLENPEGWLKAIEDCILMNNDEFSKFSAAARDYSVNWLNDPSVENQTVDLLEFSLQDTKSVNA